jgi:general secretion pathway protein G
MVNGERETMKRGFTLIELIVVIAIIAVLAAIIAPNAFKAIEKAKVVKIEGDFKSLKAVVMSFYADTGVWPASDMCHSQGGGDAITVETADFITGVGQPAGWDGPYLDRWPATPFRPAGSYAHVYYNFVYACYPWGFGDVVNTADVYLQAGSATENIARKVKQDIDGSDFSSTDPYSQGGTIRYYFPPSNILYYVIAENVNCGAGDIP